MSTSHTEREILSQPEVWATTLAGLDVAAAAAALTGSPLAGSRSAPVTDVLVTGCGSTHYLALSAAALLRDAGVRARALPASELLATAAPPPWMATTAVLAFSRSGTTTETVRAAHHARALGAVSVVAVTCDPDSPLARAADVGVAVPAAAERSVAQTRSFTSMHLVAEALALTLAGESTHQLDALPDAAATLLASARPGLAALARDAALTSYFFLGGGPLFGIASEAMLKLKEMSLTSSEAYHPLEFRHGPMSMCEPAAAVVGLLDPARAALERAVYDDVAALGSPVVTIGAGGTYDVPAALPARVRPVLHLLPLQLLALERALAKGLDPDSPRHLSAVIHLYDDPEGDA